VSTSSITTHTMARRRTFRRKRYAKGRRLNPRMKKQVKMILSKQVETKYHLYSLSAGSATTSAALASMTAIPQGDTDITRDGDRLYLKKVYIRGFIAVGDITNVVRMVVFQWKPATTPTASDVFLTGPSGSIDVFSHYSHDTRQQFKILHDRTFTMIGNGGAPEEPYTPVSTRKFSMIISRKFNRQQQFIAGGTTGTNQLYVVYLSDSFASPNPAVTITAKTMFTDS